MKGTIQDYEDSYQEELLFDAWLEAQSVAQEQFISKGDFCE